MHTRKMIFGWSVLAAAALSAVQLSRPQAISAAEPQTPALPSTQPLAEGAGRPNPTAAAIVRSGQSKADLELSQDILDVTEGKSGVTSIIGNNFMIMSIVDTVDQRPAAIAKEPAYAGKPRYGAFRIGNGPNSLTYFAMDIKPDGAIGKIYIDTNQNGDLTDDGSADWDSSHDIKGVAHHDKIVKIHASWGSPVQEKEKGEYTLSVNSCDGLTGIAVTRMTGRVGSINLGNKVYPIVMGEGGNDGIFTVPADGDRTRSAERIFIDVDGGVAPDSPAPRIDPAKRHKFQGFNVAHPVEVDGHWYLFRPSISGAQLVAEQTTAPGETPKPSAPVTNLLAPGTKAPDFTVQTPDGKPLNLSDFKGKVVVLDFWATWCQPCQQSMPGLEKLYQQIKDQNVVVLSVCVRDKKEPFDKWIALHADKDYHFTFGFDPAGTGPECVSSAKYNVTGIPTQYVVGTDGTVIGSTIGYNPSNDSLVESLKKAGIKFKPAE